MNIKHVDDYYPQIKERFPDLENWEIDKILKHGMRSFYLMNVYGADVLIRNHHFTMFFGRLFTNKTVKIKYAELKWRIKLRVQWKRKKCVWDGYYYFGLTENEYKKYFGKKKPGRLKQKITFDYIYGFKIPEETYIAKLNNIYVFKIQFKDAPANRMSHYVTNYTTRDITYVGKWDYKTRKLNTVD